MHANNPNLWWFTAAEYVQMVADLLHGKDVSLEVMKEDPGGVLNFAGGFWHDALMSLPEDRIFRRKKDGYELSLRPPEKLPSGKMLFLKD